MSLSVLLVAVLLLLRPASPAQQPARPADYAARLAELEQERRDRPDDLAVLDALAGSYAMGGRYDQAIDVVQRLLELRGEDAALRLRLAKLYSWGGRPERALAELRRAPGTAAPAAIEFECQVLTALARAREAAGCYERLLKVAPAGTEALELHLQAARNWSWSHDTGRAVRQYEAYLRAQPSDRTAALELIRLYRYRGSYGAAERWCDRLLAAKPADAEVLALKAEVLHWSAHKWFTARRAAGQAREIAPGYPDALLAEAYALRRLGQRREAAASFAGLRSEVHRRGLQPQATYTDGYRLLESDFGHPWRLSETPAYSIYNDSDAIRNVYTGLRLAAPVRGNHAVHAEFSRYASSAPAASIFTAGRDTSRSGELRAGTTVLLAPGAHLTVAGGGSRRQGSTALRGLYSLHLEVLPADRWTLEFTSAREFLSVTPRAIDLDTSSYRAGAGMQYQLDSRTSLTLRADRRFWNDDNRSLTAEGVFRRVLHYRRPFMIDGGLLDRWEQFERDTRFAAGFFTPDQYRRHDAFLGLHGEVGRWMTYEVRGSGGAHKVTHAAQYRPSWEGAGSLSIWFTRTLGLYASYQRRNYSLLSRDGWYQGFYFGLALRQ